MSIEECIDSFERSLRYFRAKRVSTIGAREDRNLARATAEAWFRNYRPSIVNIIGEDSALEKIDKQIQEVLHLSISRSRRTAYIDCLKKALGILKRELAIRVTVSQWGNQKSQTIFGNDLDILQRLGNVVPDLANSYKQVLFDLADERRISFKGTASELREVLRTTLDILAPDEQIRKQSWFKESRKRFKDEKLRKRKPTMTEKTRYILETRAIDSSEIETAGKAITDIDERLGAVVRAVYRRASSASHVQKEKEEVMQVLRYVNALLFEILQ